jgi:hypothetical protein
MLQNHEQRSGQQQLLHTLVPTYIIIRYHHCSKQMLALSSGLPHPTPPRPLPTHPASKTSPALSPWGSP